MTARRRRRVEDAILRTRPRCWLRSMLCAAPGLRLSATLAVLCAALGAVLLVLRLDGRSRRLPLGVGPVPQVVKVAAGRQMLAAVHGDGLAREPRAAIRQQKRRQILQLLDTPGPPHGVEARCA